jgi:hypothetical protein
VHQSRGKYSFSNLRRKSGVKTLSTGFTGEDSKTKIFEHLENFLSLGEQTSSGGGATTTVISAVGKYWDRLIGVQDKEGMNEEKDRSHMSDLSARDRHMSNPGKVHGS